MKFYIQKNINEKDVNELVDIFKKHQIEYELFYHIPFDESFPELDKTKKSFLYAASSVTDNSIIINGNFSGVFSHTKDINLKNFIHNSSELMWNEPIYMGKFKNFKADENEFFIRPLIDSKWIAGTVMSKNDFLVWKEKLVKIDFDFDELIFVSKVNQPEAEYRLFFVNKNYSTGTQYKKNYKLLLDKLVPNNVIEIANLFVNKNNTILPNSFVVDVGFKENKLGIIEVNGINNAGFYLADKEKLVLDLKNN